MKIKIHSLRFLLVFCLTAAATKTSAQCFEIESILVDACGPQEGLNEMVRFKIGAAAVNTATMSVTWPNNPWQGLVQNGITASKVATLNADILDAGGCGQLIEPTAGVLPANANVILVTSFNFDTALNAFGPITGNFYILFQNNPSTTSGHFANSGTGLRTLTINFGACSDSVTYDRALLTDTNGAPGAADGATVLFTPAGVASYINNGCLAPVPPFTVDAGTDSINACVGTTVALAGSAEGQQSVLWSAATGVFSNPNALNTSFTVPAFAGAVLVTLTATNSCGATVTDQVTVNVSGTITPNFATTLSLCSGAAAPVLATTAPNGITGVWSPSAISNTTSGAYVFTPAPNQCAVPVTLAVTVSNPITPDFPTTLTLCSGAAAPVLATTAPNGITGVWSPSAISNTTSGAYVFTPAPNQCAVPVTLAVTVSNPITPDFPTTLTLCSGAAAPVLAMTAPNGITGVWSPSAISNTTSGAYVFTPDSNQCAVPVTLAVTVSNSITPDFPTTLTLCSGAAAPVLATTAPNGITGVWSPSAISNTTSGAYVFTPDPNQCAVPVTLAVTVSNPITPDFPTTLTLCSGAAAPVLATTSPNGITGVWSPSGISNTTSGAYVFTPAPNQCAVPVTLAVTVSNPITPDFPTTLTLCSGAAAPVLATTAPNGITGVWSPSAISNTTSGAYVFTPAPNQCAVPVTLNVVVGGSIIPNFVTALTLDYAAMAPNLNSTSPNGVTGNWNPSVIDNTTSGMYVFTPDPNQCAVAVTLEVTVQGAQGLIPRGISPNNDGKNDRFDLSGLRVSKLSIFNRYGIAVFHYRNYTDQWNGQSDNGQELPDATYYYALELASGQTKTGWVFINR